MKLLESKRFKFFTQHLSEIFIDLDPQNYYIVKNTNLIFFPDDGTYESVKDYNPKYYSVYYFGESTDILLPGNEFIPFQYYPKFNPVARNHKVFGNDLISHQNSRYVFQILKNPKTLCRAIGIQIFGAAKFHIKNNQLVSFPDNSITYEYNAHLRKTIHYNINCPEFEAYLQDFQILG